MNQPWTQDYPSHDFDIVSPELPAGSAWLVNCLLELNVAVWQPWDVAINGEWQRISANRYGYLKPNQQWHQTLPALKQGRVFDFQADLSGRASHRWASLTASNKRLILFVRDPRDLLFSQWRRNQFNVAGFSDSFEQFLQSNYHHYPINQVDFLRLFLKLWQIESEKFNHVLIRFEDYKTNPDATLKKVLRFLQVERTDEQVELALSASDFSVVKQTEDELFERGVLQRKFNYASQPFEYQQHMSQLQLNMMGAGFNEICSWLDYQPFEFSDSKSSLVMTRDWINEMVCFILGGHGTDAQKSRLTQLFGFVADGNYRVKQG